MKPNTADVPAANRTYKARIFEMIFKDRPNLLSLYNAINGTRYENPEELEINTLENAATCPCTMTSPSAAPFRCFLQRRGRMPGAGNSPAFGCLSDKGRGA